LKLPIHETPDSAFAIRVDPDEQPAFFRMRFIMGEGLGFENA
jgi:hypothetical protein